MGEMTEREAIALRYIEPLMWADAKGVGRVIWDGLPERSRDGSNLPAIGAAVLGRLRKRGLVTILPELGLWRITAAGRTALKAGYGGEVKESVK
jgi:hypothetical protein